MDHTQRHRAPQGDLTRAGTIAAWEIRGGSLALYVRGLTAGESRDIVIDATARVPGASHGAASCAYPYYDAQRRHWTAPLAVAVQ